MCLPVLIRIQGDRLWRTIIMIGTVTLSAVRVLMRLRSTNLLPWLTLVDPEGDFRPLHRLNPTRVGFIRDEILEHFDRTVGPDCLKGLRILDIGCGGGLVCEPLVRLGATVTGIDATHRNISIAQAHAAQVDLAADYRAVTAESLSKGRRHLTLSFVLRSLNMFANLTALSDYGSNC